MQRLLIVLGISFLIFLLQYVTLACGVLIEAKTLRVLTYLAFNFLLILVVEKREMYLCIIASLLMGLLISNAYYFGVLAFPIAHLAHKKSLLEYSRPAQFYYFPTKAFDSLISEKEERKFTNWDFVLMGLAMLQAVILVFLYS